MVLKKKLHSNTTFFENEDEWAQKNKLFQHYMKEAIWWETLKFMSSLTSLLALFCLILVHLIQRRFKMASVMSVDEIIHLYIV